MIGTLEEHLIDEHEAQRVTPEWHERRITDIARKFAADPRFRHLDRDAAWWQAMLDQDERARNKGARG